MIVTLTPNPCVDKTLYLETLRLGEKHRGLRASAVAGGKGCNVSRALKSLGYETRALVIVGGPTGRHVVQMIEEEDRVPCTPIWVQGMTRTITTILEASVHRQTPLFEDGPAVNPAEKSAVLAAFRQAVQGARVVTLNGAVTSPETLTDLYAQCIPIAREAGAKVILDSYGPEFAAGLAARPNVIKPNLEEAAALMGRSLYGVSARRDALRYFLDQGVDAVVLSMGAEGLLFADGIRSWQITPPVINEVNPVGSGDALVAGLAIGLAEDWEWDRSLRFGIGAGAANAMTWDIGHFEVGEVKRLGARMVIRDF
ncbi:MAG: 1-phosphofructokinase family hexose kinase [Candidatus Hydrogenedentes bacterium]|nr:1-phosphofructokinase family hexose kinase [Candidatus Hydrogenedentota bacterium]